MKATLGLLIAAVPLAIHMLSPTVEALGNNLGEISPRDRKPVSARHRTPVLVELFTSEGCSSCPSADAELARLVKDQPIENAEIVPLSLHVDYWNNIGWKDPFSSAQFSRRQGDYGQAFRLDSVYTPQMVVDGHAEFVGSDGDRAQAAIRNAAAAPKVAIDVAVSGSSVKVAVAGGAGRRADVMLAVTEDGLSSDVRAGENSGRHLTHVAVVRSLRRVGEIDVKGAFQGKVDVAVDTRWKRHELSFVVFVQETGSRRILGVAQARDAE